MNRLLVSAFVAIACILPSSAPAAPAEESPRSRALYALGAQLNEEAEGAKSQALGRELRLRAAEAYRECSAASAGFQAEDALLKSAECFLKVGGDEPLSRAISALAQFSVMFPQSRIAADAAFLRGEIYCNQNAWGKALKTWKELAESYPASAAAPRALFRSGDIFVNQIRNTEEAVKVYSVIVEKYPQAEAADKSLFARAEIKARERSYKDAAADYVAVAEKYPKSELADKAMVQAIDIFDLSIRDYAEAHRLCLEFKKRFPHSSYISRVERTETKNQKYSHSQ